MTRLAATCVMLALLASGNPLCGWAASSGRGHDCCPEPHCPVAAAAAESGTDDDAACCAVSPEDGQRDRTLQPVPAFALAPLALVEGVMIRPVPPVRVADRTRPAAPSTARHVLLSVFLI